MGRNKMRNEDQNRILEALKEEGWNNGKNLSAKELIAQLTQVLIQQLIDSESKLRNYQMTYAEAESVVIKHISPTAITAYNGILNKELKARRRDPLWSIGTNLNTEIPPGMVGILLNYWRKLTDNKIDGEDLSQRLTNRRVRWMAKLFPYFENVWESKYSKEYAGRKAGTPEYEDIKIGIFSRLADVYAERQEISKETGENTTNTRDLDLHFFVNGDLTLNYALSPNFQKQFEDLKESPPWKYIDELKAAKSKKIKETQNRKNKKDQASVQFNTSI